MASRPDTRPPERSPEQIRHENAGEHLSAVMLNVEHALDRARKAHKAVAKAGGETNIELALADCARDLEKVRKRLFQDGYFGSKTIRLM